MDVGPRSRVLQGFAEGDEGESAGTQELHQLKAFGAVRVQGHVRGVVVIKPHA